MIKLRLLLVTLVLFSCKSYTSKELEGKWYAFYPNQEQKLDNYMELWISDTLALSYLAGADELEVYKIALRSNQITFELIESYVLNEHTFTLSIEELSRGELKTRFVDHTIYDPDLIYYLIDNKKPKIFPDIEHNEEFLNEIHQRLKVRKLR